MNDRGRMGQRYRLDDAINEILRHSVVDDIKVPPGTAIEDMCWQFQGDDPPTRILDCTREQFLEIVAKLINEIVTVQYELDKLKTPPLTAIQRNLLESHL